MRSLLLSVIKRDLLIYTRNKGEWLSSVLLFVIIVTLYPLALGSVPDVLIWVTPAIIWISAILSTMLFQEAALRTDYELGLFEQIIISFQSLPLLIVGKITAAWIVTSLPLVVLAPILGMSFNLSLNVNLILSASLLLGTPALVMVAAIGTSLTLSLPRGGMLLTVLILPLYIPILVLGTAACNLAIQGIVPLGHLALLAAISIGSIMLSPLAIGSMIKVSME